MKKNTNKNNGTASQEIVRTPVDISIEDLNHAPWNPRPKIEKKDVAELTASIEAGGLIHRIGVWKNEKGKFVVIDGNRRLEALKAIGKKTAPCDILEIDETKAREMTITANLQRTDSDPFMMADNIQQLRDKGRTIEEIAAALGKGVNWVWKRLQLTNIADCWKKAHMSGEVTFTLDALEKISRYSKELQEEVFKDTSYYRKDAGDTTWADIKWQFEQKEADLATVPFDKSECLNCTNNTATQPILFDLGSGKECECGKCTNKECFMRKYAEHTKAEKKKIEAKTGEKIKTLAYSWLIPGNRTERKTKKNTTPYIVKEGGLEKIYWGEKSAQELKPAKSDEERAAEKEEKRQKKILKGACKKVQEWAEKNLDQAIYEIIDECGGREAIIARHIAEKIKVYLYGIYEATECAIVWKTLSNSHGLRIEGLSDEETEIMEKTWKNYSATVKANVDDENQVARIAAQEVETAEKQQTDDGNEKEG